MAEFSRPLQYCIVFKPSRVNVRHSSSDGMDVLQQFQKRQERGMARSVLQVHVADDNE